ncbi:MAG: hypothetical protein ACAI44_11560 [Candidatus Sericytochromatia bacterium]
MKYALIAYDILFLALSCLTYGGAAIGVWQAIVWAQAHLPLWLVIGLTPLWAVLFCLLLIAEIFILRLPMPAVPEGKFDAPGSPVFWLWTWHFTLRRLIEWPPVFKIVMWSASLRWLAYSALGMRLAFESSMSADVDIVDPGMISIGKKSVIGGRTLIGCHVITKYDGQEKLFTSAIKIGANVSIGLECLISPGVEIGDHSTVSGRCVISQFVKIGEHVMIKPLSVVPPKTVIPDHGVWPPKAVNSEQ